MKKVQTKQRPFLLVFMLLFLAILAQKGAKSLAAPAAPALLDGCNATGIGDCLADEEFLMESETSRRFLAGKPMITAPALAPERPFCDRKVYGRCIGNAAPTRRKCDYSNLCGNRGKDHSVVESND